MKILHITPDIYEGGVASLLYDMGKYQTLQGHEVTILCVSNTKEQRSKSHFFESEGMTIVYAPYGNVYDWRIIITILKKMKHNDIVHVHLFPNQLFAAIAYTLITGRKRPVMVTTEHSTYNNRRGHQTLRTLDRWFYNKYDAIVGISPETSGNLTEWLGVNRYASRITTINNGIDLERFRNKRKKDADGIRRVIMVSRLDYPKDPLTLIRAIAKCPGDVHVIFVGSGSLDKEMLGEANRLGISPRVHLLGNRTDIPQLLAMSDIGVLSTNWDGFGLVAVEYMAAGLPVLASDVEGLNGVVGDATYLFPVGDADILAYKINQYLGDNSRYISAKSYFSKRSHQYSSKTMNRLYLNLYHSLHVEV